MARSHLRGDDDIRRFAHGLLPILHAENVPGFRRYLRRWEELVGDMSGLSHASDAEVTIAMRELQARPERFGLPSWPSRQAVRSPSSEASDVATEPPSGSPAEEVLRQAPSRQVLDSDRHEALTLFPLPEARDPPARPTAPRRQQRAAPQARQLELGLEVGEEC